MFEVNFLIRDLLNSQSVSRGFWRFWSETLKVLVRVLSVSSLHPSGTCCLPVWNLPSLFQFKIELEIFLNRLFHDLIPAPVSWPHVFLLLFFGSCLHLIYLMFVFRSIFDHTGGFKQFEVWYQTMFNFLVCMKKFSTELVFLIHTLWCDDK